MSIDATTASSIARSQPERQSDFPRRLSFAYLAFVLSALFNLLFLTFTVANAASLCILLFQATNSPPLPQADSILLGAIVVSLLVDLLYFSLRLHNRATSPYSRITYAAYFREKPASLLRLWGRPSHHRRLFFRWYAALTWMVPLDLCALLVCVLPVHLNANPHELFAQTPDMKVLDVYHQVLSAIATVLELVVAMECVLQMCQRCCGPVYPNVLVWHPQTGSLTNIHPHQYHEALVNRQITPPHNSHGVNSFAPVDQHPVHPPPAYGHQDIEDAYTAPHHQPLQYAPPQQQAYFQQQPYSQPPPLPSTRPTRKPYAQLRGEGEEQVEGQSKGGKVDKDEKVEEPEEGKEDDGEAVDEEEERGGEGGELGAETAPLVMMMSPALMDDDGAAAAPRPRVMLHVRPSDADRPDERSARLQSTSSPRHPVVHMSST